MAQWRPDPTFIHRHAWRCVHLRSRLPTSPRSIPPGKGRTRRSPHDRCQSIHPAQFGKRLGGWRCRMRATSSTTSAGTPCSSCLCPYAPHPHVERRYLVVPGLRSSRIHIIDTKEAEAASHRQGNRARRGRRTCGHTRPHTTHCGPDGIYVERHRISGRRWVRRYLRARSTRRSRSADSGSWTAGRSISPTTSGGIWVGTRSLPASGVRRRWSRAASTPSCSWPESMAMPASCMGSAQPAASSDSRSGQGTPDGARAATGTRPDRVLRVRRRGRLAQGSVVVDLGMVSRRQQRRLGRCAKSSRFPPSRPIRTASRRSSKASRRCRLSSPDINLSLDDNFLYVSCWGTGELRQYDVSDPFNPRLAGSVRIGGIVRGRLIRRRPKTALNGGPQMVEISRDGRRVLLHELTLRGVGRAVLSRTASRDGCRRST